MLNGRQNDIFSIPNPITCFDDTLHATETALRSVPSALDWAETEKRWRDEYKIELNQPEYFTAGTPAWPEEWVFRQLNYPLQMLRDRSNVPGTNSIARSQLEKQIMLKLAATLHAYVRVTEERSIPENWPRDTDQDLLDFPGPSRLAKAESFLWELHQCMVFAFRDIMKRDSQHRVIGVKNEIQEWSHPKLFVAVVQGLEQLQSKIFDRLHHDSLQSVLNQFLYRLEDEVKVWQSRDNESSATPVARNDRKMFLKGILSDALHKEDWTLKLSTLSERTGIPKSTIAEIPVWKEYAARKRAPEPSRREVHKRRAARSEIPDDSEN